VDSRNTAPIRTNTMLTYDETYNLTQSLNKKAFKLAYNTWMQAEEVEHEGADEEAEEIRDKASTEQAGHFRDLYRDLNKYEQQSVLHWLKENEDFREEFSVWFDEDKFADQFDFEDPLMPGLH